jgi:hypothetical protein
MSAGRARGREEIRLGEKPVEFEIGGGRLKSIQSAQHELFLKQAIAFFTAALMLHYQTIIKVKKKIIYFLKRDV